MGLLIRGFGLFLLVVGVVLVRHAFRSRRRVAESRLWPRVDGEILSSKVKRRPGSKPIYEARIKYRYDACGEQFVSKNVTIGGNVRAGRERARSWVERFPEGATVDVYHDPADPSVCCLERAHEGGSLELAAAAVGIAIGLALFFGVIP